MRQMQELSAEARQGTGKGPAYQARQKGRIPAVVYGGTDEPRERRRSMAARWSAMSSAGAFLTTLFMLDVGGKKTRVIPRQVQLDPVSDRPVHVDFMRLAEGATVRLDIPVHFKGQGESPGLKKGGVLNIVRHEMEMLLPGRQHSRRHRWSISSGLDIHDTLHIYDAQPAGRRQADRSAAATSPSARSWRRPA